MSTEQVKGYRKHELANFNQMPQKGLRFKVDQLANFGKTRQLFKLRMYFSEENEFLYSRFVKFDQF
jgi:hypothetical protein